MKAFLCRLRHLLLGSPEADDAEAPPFRLKRILSGTRTAAGANYLDAARVLPLDAETEGVRPLYDLSVYRSSDEDLALLLEEGSGR
ncbi:MAG TPA: hypothetical protein VJ859_07270 [Allosphingosinicella sp.]|nr:hypothetical protein [Allosphingosinicella sp.]